MTYRDKLLFFNSQSLLNKREVIDSFDDFILHHREHNNEEEYSEGKRKVLLSLCDQFRSLLLEKDIPSLTKHWMFYEYLITNDGIRLALYKCTDIEFDKNNEISSMSSTEEYVIAEVKCDYLSVEQYAKQYGVTTTTVRQWIRRGKIRTARKNGRDWLIPALADKPKRGFQSVTYHWNMLPLNVTNSFQYLSNCNCIYIYQDEDDKVVFHGITGWPGESNRQRIKMTTSDRERLELALIGTESVTVEDLNSSIIFVPPKRTSSLPILGTEKKASSQETFSDVIVKHDEKDTVFFSISSEAGSFLENEYPEPYLHPISWEFWGIPYENEDEIDNVIEQNDYSNCLKLGYLSGYCINCTQMMLDGYNPLQVCDDESADLFYIMSILSEEGGPLNEDTGEPMQDIFYIHELIIEKPLRRQGLGTKILQELPYLCKSLIHANPDILVYYISSIAASGAEAAQNSEALPDDAMYKFYNSNGFVQLSDNNLLYTFTDL